MSFGEVRYKINLLENSIDFIITGIDELFENKFEFQDFISPNEVSTRSLKYGSLHLFAGFLLLLKERLYRHDPNLIFEENKRNNKPTQHRNPKTIDYPTSIKLIKEQVGFAFSGEEGQVITGVRNFRNSLEHYQIDDINIYDIWRQLKSFLRIIDRFLVQELHISVEDLPDASRVGHKIHHISSVLERMERQRRLEWHNEAKQRAEKLSAIRSQITDEEDEEDVLEAYQEELIYCPDCHSETLVASGEFIGICLNRGCAETNPVAECSRCEQLTVGYPWELNFCDEDIELA